MTEETSDYNGIAFAYANNFGWGQLGQVTHTYASMISGITG